MRPPAARPLCGPPAAAAAAARRLPAGPGPLAPGQGGARRTQRAAAAAAAVAGAGARCSCRPHRTLRRAAVRVCGRREAALAAGLAAPQLRPEPAGAAAPAVVPLAVGLGTCCLKGAESAQQVAEGLAAGYRLVDTASHYDNEEAVAEGLARSGVPRGEVMVVTKVWFDDMGPRAAGAIDESLVRLRTDYVDLLLMHFPGTIDAVQSPARNRQLREETWRAMESALASGKARALGVANFTRRHLKELLPVCRTRPAVNQIEVHPFFQQPELIEYCEGEGIQVMAQSPLAHGELNMLENRVLKRIAEARGRTPAQVVLRWLLQQGIPPVAFSSDPARLRENLGAAGWTLSDAEMGQISFLEKLNGRVGFNPSNIA